MKIKDRNIALIFGVTMMSSVGISAVNPALPTIAGVMNVPVERVGLLIAAFAFPGIIFNPLLGILSDRVGRKSILIPGLLLFAIAGMICSFLRDFNTMVVFRFIQGIGAATLGSLNITLIGDFYDGELRNRKMGLNNSVLSLSTALFPIIGGAMTLLAWYSSFLLSLLAIPIGLLAYKYLEEPDTKSSLKLRDYFRGVFVYFRDIRVVSLLFVSFTGFFILFGAFLNYLPFLIKSKFLDNAVYFGLMITGMSGVQAIVASQLGNILKKYRRQTLIKISFLLYSLAIGLFLLMPNYWLLFVPTTILGIAQAFNMPVCQLLLSEIIKPQQRGVFMSVYRSMNNTGQVLGPVLLGLVLHSFHLQAVFVVSAIVGIISFFVLLTGLYKSEFTEAQ